MFEALITSKLGVQALNTDPRIEGLYRGRPSREAFKSSIGTWSRRKTTVMMLHIATTASGIRAASKKVPLVSAMVVVLIAYETVLGRSRSQVSKP